MTEDDDRPRKKVLLLERPPLDPLSVDDLRAYIGALREEIARAEAAIAGKQGARGHADAFFRLGPKAEEARADDARADEA